MSAVVHTGSSEARSACGTKVIIFADCAPTMRGIASAVTPARADLRKVRRLINMSLRVGFFSLLAPTMLADNHARDLARCTQPFCIGRSFGFGVTPGRRAPTAPRGGPPELERTGSDRFVAMVIPEPSLHTNTEEYNLTRLAGCVCDRGKVEGNPA